MPNNKAGHIYKNIPVLNTYYNKLGVFLGLLVVIINNNLQQQFKEAYYKDTLYKKINKNLATLLSHSSRLII